MPFDLGILFDLHPVNSNAKHLQTSNRSFRSSAATRLIPLSNYFCCGHEDPAFEQKGNICTRPARPRRYQRNPTREPSEGTVRSGSAAPPDLCKTNSILAAPASSLVQGQ